MRARHLLVAGALSACVRGANGPPITPVDVGHATAAAPQRDVPAAKGACLIKNPKSTLDLKVRAGGETLDLRIIDLPTESEIDRDGNALVHVRGDIELDGRLVLANATDANEPSLHVTRDLTLLGGMVKLGTETEISRPRRLEDSATGIVLVGWAEVEDLPVPCDALQIGERSTGRSTQMTTNENEGEGDEQLLSWVGPHGDILPVCSSPSGDPPCIRTKDMTFEEMRRSGSSVEVRARFDDGSEIRGWARADDVTKADEPARGGFGVSGGCGCGRPMMPHLRVGKPDPREHFGKAKLLAGSAIYAVPELRDAWAKATNDVVIEIEMHGGDDHARVRELPGVSTTVGCTCLGMDDHAWVKREAVIPIR